MLVCAPMDWRAAPKSMSVTWPEVVRKMLSGLTSRCSRPAACTVRRASMTGSRIPSILLKGTGLPPLRTRYCLRVMPSK